jgi:DNA adenine methylase
MTDPQPRRVSASVTPRIHQPVLPFLKWAGGKRWLFKTYNNLFPLEFGRYIEPFLGSGAIFFSLNPNSASLSDCNEALIECYAAIKADPGRVEALLEEHDAKHEPEYYYEIRNKRFRTPTTKAAAFIYLNRVCWNGLYRVNQQGQFNVPIGTKTAAVLDTDDFSGVSRRLRRARLNDWRRLLMMRDTRCRFEVSSWIKRILR